VNDLRPAIEALPLPVVPDTYGVFARPRVLIALVLVALAAFLMLVSVLTGYLDYTSPVAVMIRNEMARSGYQISSSQVVSELELGVSPMSASMLGSILFRGTTLMALACLAGAWVVGATGRSGTPDPAEGQSALDDQDEPAPEGDAGPFFD
jgi:hypothetical protein